MIRPRTAWIIFSIALVVFGLLFLWPVLRIISGGFFVEGDFTLRYLLGVFRNPIYAEGLVNSLCLCLGLGTTLLATLIALPLAWPGKSV